MCSCLWMNIAMPREPRSRKRTDTAHARKLEILIDCWGLVRTDAVRWISGDYWVLALSQFLCWASLWCKRTCRELLLRAIKKKKKKREAVCCEVMQRWVISVRRPPPRGGWTGRDQSDSLPMRTGELEGPAENTDVGRGPTRSAQAGRVRAQGRKGPSSGKVKATSQWASHLPSVIQSLCGRIKAGLP